MNWITVVWAMISAAPLPLAGIHFFTWLAARDKWEHLWFAIAAAAAASMSVLELKLIHTQTPADYGEVLRWMHVSAAVLAVALAWFIHLYLGGRRAWLPWSVTVVRGLVLVPNFLFYPNATFSEISSLHHIGFLGESFSVPVGEPNPWRLLIHLGGLLLLALTLDSAASAWKQGQKRRALVIGAAMMAGVTLSAINSHLVVTGVLPNPFIGLIFLLIVLAMAYELSVDLVRSRRLVNDLRVSEERMKLAVSAANLGLWEWDIARDEIWMNDVVGRRTGTSQGDRMSFERYLEMVHSDDREQVRGNVRRALEGGTDFQVEFRMRAQDGGIHWIAVRGKLELGVQGKPLHMRGISVDVTENKRLEEEIQNRRAELTHAQRAFAVGQLSSALAHELSQPLSAILRNAEAGELFLRRDPPDLQEVQDILADIQRDEKRAAGVIDGMRSLLKNRALRFEAIAVDELIDQVVVLLNAEVQHSRASLAVEVTPGLPMVAGDRIHLQQVIMNLLLNSLDALKEQPDGRRHIVIRADQRKDGLVELAVIDSGTGIPPERLQSILEPFVTTKAQGTGLGLAISKTIIESHGGKIWLEGNPDGGTVARFTLHTAEAKGLG